MNVKKAQAAMEYLMTYGWAILIIIVVVAALYAMGVFKVGSTVSCSPCFSYFAYVDYASGQGLKIRNGANDINVLSVTGGTITGLPLKAVPGDDITITGIATSGKVPIVVTYNVTTSGLQHTDSATINQ
jgi:hypothetical protein